MPGTVNPRNVKVGVASAWIQPYDSTLPATLPADTLAKGADWGGIWYNLGATDQGWTLNVGTSTDEIMIEEQSTPAVVLTKAHSYKVTGDLKEDTLQHARWAYGGGSLISIAPGVGTPGIQQLTLQEDLENWAIGLETENLQGFWRRYLIPVTTVGSNVQTKFRRSADARMYNFEANAICAPSQVIIREMTALAL